MQQDKNALLCAFLLFGLVGCEKPLHPAREKTVTVAPERTLSGDDANASTKQDHQTADTSTGTPPSSAQLEPSKLPWNGVDSLKTAQWEAVSAD